jgi:hypothetical protein
MHDLQFQAPVAAGESWDRGALISLNSDGELVKGCADGAMPMYAITASEDYDANSEVGGMVGAEPAAWVGSGAFEIYTTEFLATDNYTPNAYLTPATSTDAGKVKLAAAGHSSHLICGQVSQGVKADIYKQDVLYFWTMNVPKYAV